MIKIDMSDWPYEMRPWKQTMDHMLEDSFSITNTKVSISDDKTIIFRLDVQADGKSVLDEFNNKLTDLNSKV